ncbi:MAG: hypothetical protein V7459_06325 [Oceanicoccus sp.]
MKPSNLRIITLLMLTICVGLYFYTDKQKDYYDRVAIPVATNIITEISSWEKDVLLKHLSQDAQKTLNDSQLETLLVHYRKFGQLKTVDNFQFSRIASALFLFGDRKINYSADALFSTGAAAINITLTSDGNSFQIYNFTVTRS